MTGRSSDIDEASANYFKMAVFRARSSFAFIAGKENPLTETQLAAAKVKNRRPWLPPRLSRLEPGRAEVVAAKNHPSTDGISQS
jgi:hypothetical protein